MRNLKKLSRPRSLDLNTGDLRATIRRESDRAAIIMAATFIEDTLSHKLKQQIAPMGRKEQDELFDFSGPLGTFSARIKIAHAFHLIDAPLKRQIEIIKEMRNAAAHAQIDITFATPAIREAILEIFGPQRGTIKDWDAARMRELYTEICGVIVMRVLDPTFAFTDYHVIRDVIIWDGEGAG